MSPFKRFAAFVGGVVLLVAFAYLMYENVATGWVEQTISNGFDEEWKLQFLLFSRLALFPVFGVGLVLLAIGITRFAEKMFILGAVLLVINIISMVIVR